MKRRNVLEATLLGTALAAAGASAPAAQPAARSLFVTARDGTKLFVRDWGSGKPVLLLMAWTFDGSTWGSQKLSLRRASAVLRPTGAGMAGPRCPHRAMIWRA